MGSSYIDDFFRDVYNSELEHEHKLGSTDGLLVVVLLALASVVFYYFKVWPSFAYGVADCIFNVCTALLLITFVVAIWFVCRSLWPREKEYIGTPKEWGEFVVGLRDYYTHYHNEQEAGSRVADDLAQALRRNYIQAAEVNRNFNVKKLAFRYRAKLFMIGAVALVLINAVAMPFIQITNTDTQKTEVVKFPEIQKVEIVTPKP